MLPEKSREVSAWLQRAADDLRSAEVTLNANPPILGDAAFHCQQAVEKVMKGFLTAHDRPFRKTHELDVLAQACEGVDPSLRGALDPARNLTFYAWAFRYPGEVDLPSVTEVRETLAIAHNVCDAIFERLPDHVRW